MKTIHHLILVTSCFLLVSGLTASSIGKEGDGTVAQGKPVSLSPEQVKFSEPTQQGKQYVGYNLFMNFIDFIEHCHKNGLQPAEVRTREENQVLTQYLDGNFADPKYFWLGCMDIGREGRYWWLASLTEASYTSWGPGYPNGGTGENCGTIYGGDGTWYDQYCTNDGVQPLCQTIV